MKVAVIGLRGFKDKDLLRSTLDGINGISQIVSGGAPGADRLGEEYADQRGIEKRIFSADLKNINHPQADVRVKYGRKYDAAAGFRRNRTIIENADLVVAFWDQKSRGTQNSLEIAK